MKILVSGWLSVILDVAHERPSLLLLSRVIRFPRRSVDCAASKCPFTQLATSEGTSVPALSVRSSQPSLRPLVVAVLLAAASAQAQGTPEAAPAQPPRSEPSAVQPPAPPGKATPAKDSPVTVTAAPGRGIVVKTADDRFSLGLRARAQFRDTFSHSGDTDTNELQIRTLRLVVHGNVLAPELRYNIQLALGGGDFERDSSSPIFDAFLEYTKVRDLNIRVGQFFVPFDRARTIREFALQFVDRQQVVRELSLDRDVGLMLSSSNLFGLGDRLAYNLFLGEGAGRNRFGAQTLGPLLVARLTLRPFGAFDDDQEGDLSREKRPRLAIGFAGARNLATNRQNSTYGTTFTVGTVDYTNAAVDIVFKYAGFSLLAEGLWRRANVDALEGTTAAGAPVQEWTRSGYGYFVQAGMLVQPTLEVVGRWEQLHARGGTDPQFIQLAETQGRQVAGGVNFYANGHALKLQSDYVYVFGHSGTPRHFVRLQVDASF